MEDLQVQITRRVKLKKKIQKIKSEIRMIDLSLKRVRTDLFSNTASDRTVTQVIETDIKGVIMTMYESETVELKEIYTPDLKKEVVAFANTNGVTIYIGVQDSGEITGLENADFVMQQISNAVRDGIRPDVSMFTHIELVKKEDKNIIRITVLQGTKKPYYISDKGLKPSGVYVRSGTTSAPASEDAIRMMIKITECCCPSGICF